MGEILSQITRIDNNIQNALAKVAAKGVTVSADAGSDELPGLIEQIPTGVDLPELDTPGTSADLRSGKQLIDGDGNVVEGSMPTATQATPGITVSSGGLITASATQSAGYVAAGTKSATKQLTTQAAKTITPSKSTQTAVASGRYTTGAITVGAIPSQYIVPSGTKSITANGTHDVKSYASVNVDVAGSGGGGVETCTVTINRNNSITLQIGHSTIENGSVCASYNGYFGSAVIDLVCVKGSCLTFNASGGMARIKSITLTGAEVLQSPTLPGYGAFFIALDPDHENVTISLDVLMEAYT
jgi:hypothetical protein